MPTLCRTYMTDDEADAAVDRLMDAGVPVADVRVLRGDATKDARETPMPGFADAAVEAVGSYAGAPHAVRDGMGAFAGDPGRQRRGGFADIDRETVTTHHDGVRRVRVASHHHVEAMLVDAGLDEATARADVAALHEGRVLVLVRSGVDEGDLAATLDG